MNVSRQSATVVFPIQIGKKDGKIWKNIEEIETVLKNNLIGKELTDSLGDNFSWKKIDSINTQVENGQPNAFEDDQNKERIKRNFTKDVVDTLYDSSRAINYWLMGVNHNLYVTKDNDEMYTISTSSEKKGSKEIRKVHLLVTNLGTSLCFIEMAETEISSEEEIINENENWKIDEICEKFLLSEKDNYYVDYPTNCHVYLASLVWGKQPESKIEYCKNYIRKWAVDEGDNTKDIKEFFGVTCENFWICVLQKMVAAYISSIAGSKKINEKHFEKLYNYYIIFDNQFNFIETSYDSKIQIEYEEIRKNMKLDDEMDKVKKQIEALHNLQVYMSDSKRNIILAVITILGMIFACIQVTATFIATTNAWALLCAGGILIIVGIALIYFIFKKRSVW